MTVTRGRKAPPSWETAEETAGDEVFVFPTSFAQRRLWFIHRVDPLSPAYTMLASYRVAGPLDVRLLGRTLDTILRRHESLRTNFALVNHEPMQLVSPARKFSMPLIEVRGRTDRERVAESERWLGEEARRPFDLERGSLFRAALLRLGAEDHVLSVSMHHIVSDGWSLSVLLGEVSELYGAFLEGRAPRLPELGIQYADYAAWQRDWFRGRVLEEQVAYWEEELAGVPQTLELPLDHPRGASRSQRGGLHRVCLAPDLSGRLRVLGRERGATPYMVLLAGFQALLVRYTGQEQVLVGSPIAGRTRRETEGLIGFFINTLVMRGDLRGDPGFGELVGRVKETTLGAYAHQDVPFEKLVEVLSPQRDLSRTPLCQVMFILQNAPMGRLELGEARLEELAVETGTAKFDITLSLEDRADGGIEGYWEYDLDLFEPATVERMAGHYERLLEAAVEDPERPVGRLEMMSPQERRRLLVEWNGERRDYGSQRCLHELFEQNSERLPEAIAVDDEVGLLTNRELNERANRLARFLRERGIGPDRYAAIVMEPSHHMIVAVLGVLKAGGAYVPLDPRLPARRIASLLEQSGASIALTSASVELKVAHGVEVVAADVESASSPWAAYDASNLPPLASIANAAYIIFTSGSTGRPKGVVVEHRQLLNYFHGIVRRLGLCPGVGYAMLQPMSVDSTNTVLIPWMCLGGILQVPPQDSRADPQALADFFSKRRMEVLKIAPTHLAILLGAGPADALLPTQGLALGGEASHWDWIRHDVLPRMPSGSRAFIHYGPTETTVGVLTHQVDADEVPRGPLVPIGRPLPNVAAYVVSPALMPVAVGVTGEILIGGASVARGYLRRPGFTAERFLPDPFSDIPGARLYRTGDLARRLPSGAIEFLGRTDNQLKIRGFRIELGEVESLLLEHQLVDQAVVLARDDGQGSKRLVAYVTLKRSPEKADPLEIGPGLRDWLTRRLPDYMVPTAILVLDTLPQTAQGKLDPNALPAPFEDTLPTAPEAVPRNLIEARLAALWEELLQVPSIGIHDNFFDIGGHSLMAVRMLAMARERFRIGVSLSAFLNRPTVANLAFSVTESGGTGAPEILIDLKRGERTAPFVCVHPIGGNVACYVQLARALSPSRSFCAMQAPTAAPESIPELGDLYLKELRRFHPQGPYCLGGWSFGGLVAFEMARQLEENGEPPRLLALFDTYPPDREAAREGDPSLLERFAADLASTLGRNPAEMRDDFLRLAPKEQRKSLLQALRREGLIDPASDREFEELLSTFSRNARAAQQYRLAPIGAVIDLFVAKDGAGRKTLPHRWAAWTRAGVMTHLVEGDHYSMVRPPHVEGLAAALEQRLTENDGRGGGRSGRMLNPR